MKTTSKVRIGVGFFASILLLLTTVGCLRTRSDIIQDTEQKKEMKSQLTTLQQSAARDQMRFDEYESQFRELSGRIETLEHQLSETERQKEEAVRDRETARMQTEERLKIYEEALRTMEVQTQKFNQELEQLRTEKAAATAALAERNQGVEKGSYKSANEAFQKKEWKTAIVGFQKYREAHPKGKYYGAATLKIGLSFRELGMGGDAKPFLSEVVEKFPKSKEAKDAKAILKTMK